MVGVCRRKSGRFSAEIRDPIKKRKVWLGTFSTPEEASKAYLSKKQEFLKQLEATRKIHPTFCNESKLESSHASPSSVPEVKTLASSDGNSEPQTCNADGNCKERVELESAELDEGREIPSGKVKMSPFRSNFTYKHTNYSRVCGENSRTGIVGVYRRKSGRFYAEIRDPIKKRKGWLGTFNTAEEASKAYLSKKQEFRTQLEAARKIQPTFCNESKLESSHATPSSVPEVKTLASSDGNSEPQTCNADGNCKERVELESAELDEGGEIPSGKVKMSSFRSNFMYKHTNYGWNCGENSRTGIVGVYRRKSGRFYAEIRDPIKKRRVWLGTFNTAEEASKAYVSKKQEFLTLLEAARKIQPTFCNESKLESSHASPSSVPEVRTLASPDGKCEPQTCNADGNCKERVELEGVESDEGREILSDKAKISPFCSNFMYEHMNFSRNCGENSRTGIVGVYRRKSGRFYAEIRDPIKKRQVRLGTFDTAEEASKAYVSKKQEFLAQLEATRKIQPTFCNESKLESSHASPSSVPEVRTLASPEGNSEPQTCNAKGNCEESVELDEGHEIISDKVKMAHFHSNFMYKHMSYRRACGKNSRTGIIGVYRRKSGRFYAEIRDPVKKRQVRLGTFNTAEEASKAYLSKKQEFRTQLEAKRKVQPTFYDESKLETSHVSPSSMPEIKTLALPDWNSEPQTGNANGNCKEGMGLESKELDEGYEIVSDKVKMSPFHSNFINKQMNYSRGCGENSRSGIVGVCRRKSGRFSAEIRDPIGKRKVNLGTFNTAEEASTAYLSKKEQFLTQLEARRKIQPTFCMKSKLESSHGHPSSVPEIKTLASSDWKSESQTCDVCSESQTCIANGDGNEVVKLESVELDEGYAVIGLALPNVPSFPVANFGSEFFLPIVDTRGFLLGEFSKLDDLSICNTEDENVSSSEFVPGPCPMDCKSF